jgi:hypothetical protein
MTNTALNLKLIIAYAYVCLSYPSSVVNFCIAIMLTSYWKQNLYLKHVKVYPEDFFFSFFSSSSSSSSSSFFFFFFFNLLSRFYLKGIM